MTGPRLLPAAAALLLTAGCAAPRYAGPAFPETLGTEGRCRFGAGGSSPLVTEWPASEKANLEALLQRGAVAVEYSGCSMRVLTQCQVRGAYAWQRTTPEAEIVEIADEDQLWSKLPLGAVSLEGELRRSGKLTIHTWVAGQMRLEGTSPADVPVQGECARATHLVGALAVGAFSLNGSGKSGASAGVEVARLGTGGARSDRSAGLVRAAGNWQVCGEASAAAPHPDCRSPIQVFLWPLPGRAAEDGPPGTVKVDLVSANASSRWDVYYDDEVICTTPCSRWLDPSRPLLLRTRESSFMRGSELIRVHDLEPWAGGGALQLQAHATSNGKLVTGITFTTFGGIALLTGIVLASAGCGDGMSTSTCQAGLTTLAAGALVTSGSVWLIFDALPRAEIRGSGGRRYLTLGAGPGFVAGRF